MKVAQRRLALLMCAAALLVAAFAATPAANADALNAGGVPVAPGFLVVANSTFVTITGPYAQTIICTQSNLQYKIVLNNVRGVTVRGDLTNWTFNNCSLPTNPPTPCTVTVTPPVWPSQVEMNNTTKTVDISFINGKVLTTTCAGVTCNYQGAGAVPPLSISGGWTDSPRGGGPARINFVNQGMNFVGGAAACGRGAVFSALYNTVANNLTLTP